MYLKRVADLRIDSDLKQKDIALLLRVSRSVYSKWENGDNNVPLNKLDKLTVKYNVSLDYIFGFSKHKQIEGCKYSKIDFEVLCHNMRLLRKRNGYTQKFLAYKFGISKSTYSRYETGALIIPIDKFYLLGQIYGVSLDVLAGKVKLSKRISIF